MKKVVTFPLCAEIKELEARQEEIRKEQNSIEHKMDLCMLSDLPISGETREKAISLLIESVEIADKICELKGITKEEREQKLNMLAEAAERADAKLDAEVRKDIPLMPKSKPAMRRVIYTQMSSYMEQINHLIEEGGSLQDILPIFDKVSYIYGWIATNESDFYEEVLGKDCMPGKEFYRIMHMDLASLCAEMLEELRNTLPNINHGDVEEAKRIEHICVCIHALFSATG